MGSSLKVGSFFSKGFLKGIYRCGFMGALLGLVWALLFVCFLLDNAFSRLFSFVSVCRAL